MHLNPDCLRDILIAVEGIEYGSQVSVPSLADFLPQYTYEQLSYHCRQLYDAGYIEAIATHAIGRSLPEVSKINDLTFAGHQFLADVRSDYVWDNTKAIAKKIGSTSIDVLSNVASKVLTNLIANHLSP